MTKLTRLTRLTKQNGFTLLEMMAVIAILAILTAIAYPNYQTYVQRGRMEAARNEVIANVKMMEQNYFKNRNTCKDGDTASCTSAPTPVEQDSAPFYDVTINLINKADEKADYGNYIILSEPNSKASYSSDTKENKQLFLVYYSRSASFVKCNESGFNIVKSNMTKKRSEEAEATGCVSE